MSAARQAKLTRRILFASVLAAASIWYLAGVMEFDKQALLSFVVSSVFLVLGVIAAALLVVVPFKLLRTRRKRKQT